MSKNYKFWTGVLAFVPFLMLAVYFIYFVWFMFHMINIQRHAPEMAGMEGFIGLFIVGFLMAITGIAGFIFFLIHIINDKKMDSNERLVWILIFVFANIITYPIYWYMKIFKEPVKNAQET